MKKEEILMKKSYVVTEYSHRRFSATKKVGWKVNKKVNNKYEKNTWVISQSLQGEGVKKLKENIIVII